MTPALRAGSLVGASLVDVARFAHLVVVAVSLVGPGFIDVGARLLEATAAMVRSGITLVPDIPDDAITSMADAFTCDAAALRILIADHGSSGGATPTN